MFKFTFFIVILVLKWKSPLGEVSGGDGFYFILFIHYFFLPNHSIM